MFRSSVCVVALISCAFPLRAITVPAPTLSTRVIISVRDQKLMLIENGTIADIGPHEELMKKLGTYRRLYELQFLDKDQPKAEITHS